VLENHRAGLRGIAITLVLLISVGQTALAQPRVDGEKTPAKPTWPDSQGSPK
jgi:hypothetical protein